MLRECEAWWQVANDRRQLLILRKHGTSDLTKEEERELDILQNLAEMVVDNADLFQPND